ncbi:YigZ family protein [Christensenellaceae bacterium OttesenSCG-928-K19]|nr:YigZ family protein [Christensenellaceae bacterium OttesenSCG-928-K19]
MGYTSIRQALEDETVVKKSRFICALRPVQTPEEAADELAKIRKKHYNATHNCFAMILNEDASYKRASDDGEPQGTAGIPMLEVLQKAGLTNILAVVTRYFGGTMLGAGGLVRAYSGSVAQALGRAQKVVYIPADEYEFTVHYSDYGKLCSIATEFNAAPEGRFEEVVRVRLVVEKEYGAQFKERIKQAFLGAEVYTVTGECMIMKPAEYK